MAPWDVAVEGLGPGAKPQTDWSQSMAIAQSIILQETTNILDVVEGQQWTIVSILLCNATSDPETITVYVVPMGEEPSQATTILNDVIVERHSTQTWEHQLILEAGDSIVATATFGGNVTATVSYYAR